MRIREHLHAAFGTWTEEINLLLEALPADLLQEWEVYEREFEGRPLGHAIASSNQHRQVARFHYPSDAFQLSYVPEAIKTSGWIEQTNTVAIRFQTGYDRDFDVDPDGDREKRANEQPWESSGEEPKYVVKGTFVDPIITRSIDRVVEHVETEMERVATATEFNAEIERLTYPQHWQLCDAPQDPSEYVEQRSPVISVDGVGSTSVERLAQRFGTYYNITVGHSRTISDCLSHWHHPSSTEVIEMIEEIINRYNRFRQRDDWNRINVAPDSWTDYPKEQPR